MKKRYFIAFVMSILFLLPTHRVWLGAKYAKHFDLMIMLIIIICGFLFFLKLASYMADFKDLKNKSRVEIVFLTMFAVICVIPVINITSDDHSVMENRYFAVRKPFINEDFSINNNFGKDFNDWFSDRFYLREKLLFFSGTLNYMLSYGCYETPAFLYNKKTNWTIDKKSLAPLGYDEDILSKSSKAFIQLKKYCDNRNIKLYILIVPTKSVIYPVETAGLFYKNLVKERIKEEQDVVRYLKTSSNCKIIYPYKELKNGAKEDFVFFKSEHHWSDWGAYIGYKELSKEIKKDFNNFHIVSLSEYNISSNKLVRGNKRRKFLIGSTIDKLPIPKIFKKNAHKNNYKYYDNINKNKMFCETNIDQQFKIFHYPCRNHLKIFSTGTSMNENLNQFLPYSVEYTHMMRFNSIKGVKEIDGYKFYKRFHKKISEYNPNILIVCLTFENIRYMPYLFDKE